MVSLGGTAWLKPSAQLGPPALRPSRRWTEASHATVAALRPKAANGSEGSGCLFVRRAVAAAPRGGPGCQRRVPCCSTLETMENDAFSDSLARYSLFAAVGSLVWVRFFDELARRDILEQKLSRKLVHITTGPLFMLTWPLFSASPIAPLLAAAVPLLNGIKLVLVGTGLVKDDNAVRSISREGNPTELLRGPLFYVLAMSVATAVFWRTSPVGLAALAIMCGGDGLADIAGRRLGATNRLPYNPAKSWAGSIAMVIGGAVLMAFFLWYFSALGYLEVDPAKALPAVAVVAVFGALIESLPLPWLDDNLSVPVVTMAVAAVAFA